MSYGTYTYGKTTVDMDRLPELIQKNFIQRTIGHKLGNEVNSALLREREKAEKEGREVDEDEIVERLRNEMVEKFYAGTIGIRVTGPRGTTLENIAFELAGEAARKLLEPKGLWPMPNRKLGIKAEDATAIFGGEPRTREEITDMMLEKYRDRFMGEAKAEQERRVAEAKARKEAKVPVKAEGTSESLEDVLALD